MFGSIGIPELIVIFLVVMLVFGPDKLPDFAKTFAKTVRDFRKTINDAKTTIEEEFEKANITTDLKNDFQKELDQLDIAHDLRNTYNDLKNIDRSDSLSDYSVEKDKNDANSSNEYEKGLDAYSKIENENNPERTS